MTVQELIDELQKVEDKSLEVEIFSDTKGTNNEIKCLLFSKKRTIIYVEPKQ